MKSRWVHQWGAAVSESIILSLGNATGDCVRKVWLVFHYFTFKILYYIRNLSFPQTHQCSLFGTSENFQFNSLTLYLSSSWIDSCSSLALYVLSIFSVVIQSLLRFWHVHCFLVSITCPDWKLLIYLIFLHGAVLWSTWSFIFIHLDFPPFLDLYFPFFLCKIRIIIFVLQ